MRILQIFKFLLILWHNQFALALSPIRIIQNCKHVEFTTPLLDLKKNLFCNYDSTVRPNNPKVITNVTLKLMPKMMEFSENGVLTLHSWMSFSWTDTYLTWNLKDTTDEITYFHVKSHDIWLPDVHVYNSGDLSNDERDTFLNTECLVFNTGTVICVPPVKYILKCNPDYTYWPYDQHTCRILFGSWSHTGEEVDIHLDGTGVNMDSYENSTVWDFKLLNAEKLNKKYKCCPNDTFPRIDYTFLLTRHGNINHRSYITPAIALIFLTLTVLWLDSRSVERVAIASVNLICHLLCIFDLHWMLPYNGVNPPNIMLFYRDSLILATFALILTALLRKLQNMNMEMPSWMSSTTMLILSNKAGRFLVLNDDESKIAGDTATEDSSDLPKSRIRMRESSWRYFATIVEWLSFCCVIFTYIIILITLVPAGSSN